MTLAVYEWREQVFSSQPDPAGPDQLILAFDEPDTHLDYLSQRKIFEIIKKIGQPEQTNVIVCTHSLNLIDRIPLTDVVHFELENRTTRIRTLASEDPELIDYFMYQISDAMGLRNSVMLNERCFLVVEGLTELTALPVLFSIKYGFSPQAAGVRILNGEGGAGARLFAKFLHQNRRNVIFMIDSDTTISPKSRYFTPASLTSDGIDINKQVHFVGAREFEDTFSDSIYLRTAKKHWPKHDGSAWTVEEFSELRDKDHFSDELVALVRRNTRMSIGKPEIGYDVARSLTDASEIPDQILACIEQSYRAANASS
jgi:predicted ATP-dependent endonuclease of OLD family